MITIHPVLPDLLTEATYLDKRAFIAPFETIAILLLGDPEQNIRKSAITLCGAVGTEACITALVDRLSDISGGDLLVLGSVLSQHRYTAGRILLDRLSSGKPNEMQETYLSMLKYTACPELLTTMQTLYQHWFDLRDMPHLNGRFVPGEYHREVLIDAVQAVDYRDESKHLALILDILASAARDESAVVRSTAVLGLTHYIRKLLQTN